MITICVGNPGSGKTVSAVRDMMLSQRPTYSNIKTMSVPNNHMINHEMIIKKDLIKTIKKKDGSLEPQYKLSLNVEYWQGLEKPIDIVLDEAHTIMNPRRSMSKINIIITDWLALIRRAVGSQGSNQGHLYLITQLPGRIDVIARDMATQIRHHTCYYVKSCEKCNVSWREHTDIPEPQITCPKCYEPDLTISDHSILIHYFSSMNNYYYWVDAGQKTYYRKSIIRNVQDYFPLYDTLSWENLMSEAYL